MTERPLPAITPETRHFWEGTRSGELRLQKCSACNRVYFPPRPFCPRCASRDVDVVRASGRATLYSYVIHHRPVPGFVPPYSIAVVQLEEGPRMMTNIVDCDPNTVRIGQKVELVFHDTGEGTALARFRPAGS